MAETIITKEHFDKSVTEERMQEEVRLRLKAGALKSWFEVQTDGWLLYSEWAILENNDCKNFPDSKESRSEKLSSLFHDRARESAVELHRLLLSLSTGAVAVFFFALTMKVDPSLSFIQKIIVLVSLVAMSLATGAGIRALHADMLVNYFCAKNMQSQECGAKENFHQQKYKYKKSKWRLQRVLLTSFVIGVVSSVIYISLRILGI